MGSSSSSSTALTKVQKCSHFYTWTIEDFQLLYLKLNDRDINEIFSPNFGVIHPDGISVTTWTLKIKIMGGSVIAAYLRLVNCPKQYFEDDGGLPCNFGIALGTQSSPTAFRCETPYKFKKCEDAFGWPKLTTVGQLREKGLLVNDKLRVQVDLTIFGPAKSSNTTAAGADIQMPIPQAPVSIGTDFSCLLKSQILSDVTVSCGSVSFPAHKAILAGRSEVLKTVVTTDLEVLKCGSLVITDMSAPTFEILLGYLYTGKVDDELGLDALLELIPAAEKYGLDELKDYCSQKLVGGIAEGSETALVTAAHGENAEKSVIAALQKFVKTKFSP